MIPKDGLTLKYLRTALHRRLWYVVVPFFVVSMAALVYCIKAPKIYKSTSLILVQPPEVPVDYVRPATTSDKVERVNALRNEIMSESGLEEIIRRFSLYPEVLARDGIHGAVETMLKDIDVSLVLEEKQVFGRRPDISYVSFEVSYQGENPFTVRDVNAAIGQLFIEHNHKQREKQATATSEFLQQELERMRKELLKKEERLREFKEKHQGMLPEQTQHNYIILSQLERQLDNLYASLNKSEDRKILLRNELNRLEAIRADTEQAAFLGNGINDRPATFSLSELHQQLQALRVRYSDSHPDVIRLAATIARMEKREASKISQKDRIHHRGATQRTPDRNLLSVQRDGLLSQMRLVDREILKAREDKTETLKQIKEYRRRIEDGPRIEQLYVDLARDYDETQKNYQSLLQKKMQAELAISLERSQKGEEFRILEPADLPRKPHKPQIPKILFIGLILALNSGLALAFLNEHLDPSFYDKKQLESELQLPVLVGIPIITTPEDHRLKIYKKISTVGAMFFMASVLLYALFVVWKNNQPTLPL
jgi:polysaccharide chain length determinant protein (PEP-CTERM system associated)